MKQNNLPYINTWINHMIIINKVLNWLFNAMILILNYYALSNLIQAGRRRSAWSVTLWSTTCVKHYGIARTDTETEQLFGIYSKLKHLKSPKYDEHVKCLKSPKFDKHHKISLLLFTDRMYFTFRHSFGKKGMFDTCHKIWAITKMLFLALTLMRTGLDSTSNARHTQAKDRCSL